MVVPTTREAGVEYASTLQPLDFAFVLRSDGYWTYGIVCDIIGSDGEGDIVGVGPQGNNKAYDSSWIFMVVTRPYIRKIGHKIRLIKEDHEQSLVAAAMA